MGLATWKAVLQESQRCPFTKKSVTVEQVGWGVEGGRWAGVWREAGGRGVEGGRLIT